MSDNDYLLALQLQEFDAIDNDIPNVIKESQNNKENKPWHKQVNHSSTSNSLVDPSWETIDPTPDIHVLFIQFNRTFFWEKLNAVEVRWSPRMTLCAGVCVYQGRAGMCSIRLSLPLLKLRPRKDLVETLLHEMIHAYLFVTHNNRDRDGHGPEFHKHMNRINQQAGTKISVYHSFHDEVKLYQQHWWRCDGVCQKRPPYFGMVRRSMNRAPGPSDNWYADHQANCGGNFIKVKEPEGYNDKKKKNKDKVVPSTSKGDLSKFFPTVKKGASGGVPKNIVGFGDLNNPSSSHPNPLQGSSVNNVVGFKDLNSLTQPKKNPAKSWNGQGKKLGGSGTARPGTSGRPNNTGRPGNFGRPGGVGGGMLANRGGGTLVVTGKSQKTDDRTPTDRPLTDLTTFTPFVGTGNVLGTKSSSTPAKTLSSLLKFPSSSRTPTKNPSSLFRKPSLSSTPTKDPSSSFKFPASTTISPTPQSSLSMRTPNTSSQKRPSDSPPSSPKLKRPEREMEIIDLSDNESRPKHEMVRCPLCYIEVSEIDVNTHLDECLTRQSDSDNVKTDAPVKNEPCPVCNKEVSSKQFQDHVSSCLSNSLSEDDMKEMIDDEKKEEKDEKKNCPVCDKPVTAGSLVDHLEDCDGLQCSQNSIVLDSDSDEEEEAAVGGSPRKNPSGEQLFPCPICTQLFSESVMNKHLDVCVLPG